MKPYTELGKSKILTEILPEESADHFHNIGHIHTDGPRYEFIEQKIYCDDTSAYWPCWSLAALLDVLPQVKLDSIKQYDKKLWRCCAYYLSDWHDSDWHEEPIDACYELILKLHEQNIL